MVAIGYVLSSEQFDPSQLIDIGVAAEKGGFDMVWTSDHFQPWMDNQGHAGSAWVTLGALGQNLKRIALGTGVTCPSYRYHPAVVAQAFATLGTLYPGRVFLGVGTGEALNEQAATGLWGEYEERAERFAEAVQLIRKLWQGDIVTHKGKYYATIDAKLYTLPSQPVPIYMAASGPESAEIVGRLGDGWITDTKSLMDSEIKSAFERGAREAGKNPDTLTKHVELFVHTGDEASARELAELWRFLPKAWDKYVDNHDPRAIQQQAQQDVKIEEVLQMWLVSPDPQQHIDKINELTQAGATHIYIHSAQPDQQSVIDFYNKQVLSKVQHEVMQPEAVMG